MEEKGDIPDREEVSFESFTQVSQAACAKVAMVDEALNNGGVIHAYLVSRGDDDVHLYDFNTHRFPEQGVIYFHGDDRDKWIPGDDIGMIERHYE